MALPKGFRKKVNFIEENNGPVKRQEYLDDIDYKGMYLPKGVNYEDIDEAFINFVEKDLEIVINGSKVPVIFLTIQKWAEFSKTWEFSDKYKNFKMPFVTIVRKPDIQVGTNQAGNWNIPGQKLYTYMKVPTFIDGRKGIDTYKIPQPTSIDMSYEVKLFCNRMKDINTYQKVIQKTFHSRQFYIYIKGHPMPIHFDGVRDESQINDFDKRRFYVQNFEMKILGYILDEDDFELIPSINRANVKFLEMKYEKSSNKYVNFKIDKSENKSIYSFNFKPNSLLGFSFTSEFGLIFNSISDIVNITNIIIEVNGSIVHSGLTLTSIIDINTGDNITITISTNDRTSSSLFNLNGKIK